MNTNLCIKPTIFTFYNEGFQTKEKSKLKKFPQIAQKEKKIPVINSLSEENDEVSMKNKKFCLGVTTRTKFSLCEIKTSPVSEPNRKQISSQKFNLVKNFYILKKNNHKNKTLKYENFKFSSSEHREKENNLDVSLKKTESSERKIHLDLKKEIKFKNISFQRIFNQSMQKKKLKEQIIAPYFEPQKKIKVKKNKEKSESTRFINISCAEIQTDETTDDFNLI